MKIAEIITTDGEVITEENLKEKKVLFELLSQVDFNSLREFFIKKTIILLTKDKEKKSGGTNGLTPIEVMEEFKWKDIEVYLEELVQKGSLVKRQSINTEVYFTKQKIKK
jgi:hypothetical protein